MNKKNHECKVNGSLTFKNGSSISWTTREETPLRGHSYSVSPCTDIEEIAMYSNVSILVEPNTLKE